MALGNRWLVKVRTKRPIVVFVVKAIDDGGDLGLSALTITSVRMMRRHFYRLMKPSYAQLGSTKIPAQRSHRRNSRIFQKLTRKRSCS